MATRFKPGSRVQQMWALYEAKGPAAATALGPSLNLSPSTIKSWVRTWDREKEGGPRMGDKSARPPKVAKEGKPVKPPKEPVKLDAEGKPIKKLPKRIKGYKFQPTGKKRVRCTYMPKRLGWLMVEGPEQSEIRWDDDFGEQNIPNEWIKEVTPKEEAIHAKKYRKEVPVVGK